MARKHPAAPASHTLALDVDAIRDDIASNGPPELVEERLGYARKLIELLTALGITSAVKGSTTYTVRQLVTVTGSDRLGCHEAFAALLRPRIGTPLFFANFVNWEIGGRRTETYSPRKSMVSLNDDVFRTGRGGDLPRQGRKRELIAETLASREKLTALFDAWFHPTIASKNVQKCKDEWDLFWVAVIDLIYYLSKIENFNRVDVLISFASEAVETRNTVRFKEHVSILLDRVEKRSGSAGSPAARSVNRFSAIVDEAVLEADAAETTDRPASTRPLTSSAPACPPEPGDVQRGEGDVGKGIKREMNGVAAPATSEAASVKYIIATLAEDDQKEILADIVRRLGLPVVDPTQLVTVNAAASMLDLEPNSIKKQITSGGLNTVALGDGRKLVSLSDCKRIWPEGRRPHGRRFGDD